MLPLRLCCFSAFVICRLWWSPQDSVVPSLCCSQSLKLSQRLCIAPRLTASVVFSLHMMLSLRFCCSKSLLLTASFFSDLCCSSACVVPQSVEFILFNFSACVVPKSVLFLSLCCSLVCVVPKLVLFLILYCSSALLFHSVCCSSVSIFLSLYFSSARGVLQNGFFCLCCFYVIVQPKLFFCQCCS